MKLKALLFFFLAIPASHTYAALLADFVQATGAQGGPATSTIRLVRNTGSSQSNTYGSTGGGEFRIEWQNGGSWEALHYDNADGNDWVLKTFCLELKEHIGLNTHYTATIDDAAWYGKNLRPGNTSPEPLLAESQLLYGLYAEGRLASASGVYSYQNTSSANDLQYALWAFEDGTSISSGQAGFDLWQWAQNNVGNYTLNGEVKVLNIWNLGTTSGESNSKQSQFIYVVTPEPGTFVMWSLLGLCGIGFGRRRMR